MLMSGATCYPSDDPDRTPDRWTVDSLTSRSRRERLKKQLEKTRNQKEKLESLCRSLQAERKANPVGGNSLDSIPV
ncbi:hypothetical protein OROHE_008217 [Orobanche hederae]